MQKFPNWDHSEGVDSRSYPNISEQLDRAAELTPEELAQYNQDVGTQIAEQLADDMFEEADEGTIEVRGIRPTDGVRVVTYCDDTPLPHLSLSNDGPEFDDCDDAPITTVAEAKAYINHVTDGHEYADKEELDG
jgi:hypothetical protein